MSNINVQEFLNSLTGEQRAAVLACKTEDELEQVIDDYDIDLPDEMLAEVAGGKGILPFIMMGIIACSVGGSLAPAIPVSAAKVCLVQDIEGKGKKGDIIDVSDGYAKNYLIPKGMAVSVTEEMLSEKKSKDDSESYHKEQGTKNANELAKLLNGKSITLYGKSGANGKLFGSITNKNLANAIESTYNIHIDKKDLNVPEIKNFGSYEIEVNCGMDVIAYMTVKVCQE